MIERCEGATLNFRYIWQRNPTEKASKISQKTTQKTISLTGTLQKL